MYVRQRSDWDVRLWPEEKTTLARNLKIPSQSNDQAASLALYIALDLNLVGYGNEDLIARLMQTSSSGYALASFYFALFTEAQSNMKMKIAENRYWDYIDFFDLAEHQGLDSRLVDQVRGYELYEKEDQ